MQSQRSSPLLPSEAQRALDIAIRAAQRAGQYIKTVWHAPRDIALKEDASLVTEVDLKCEALIRETLALHRPGEAILGEEGGGASPKEGLCWYVDPVDGTTNLAHHFPWICVSIALLEAGIPQAGVLYNPIQEHLFVAQRGKGATLNGSPLQVSTCSEMKDSLLATGFAIGSGVAGPYENMSALAKVLPRCHNIRRAGSAALDLAAVAAGWLDGFWEFGLHPWDSAAGWLMVEEAGGTLSKLDGSPYDPHVPEVVASNGKVHRELLAILNG